MRLDRATQVQPSPVQPKQAKIKALRELMSHQASATQLGCTPTLVQPNIDADGNVIPDF